MCAHICGCLQRSEDGVRFPLNWSHRQFSWGELNSGPLQEQRMLLITEPSLQPKEQTCPSTPHQVIQLWSHKWQGDHFSLSVTSQCACMMLPLCQCELVKPCICHRAEMCCGGGSCHCLGTPLSDAWQQKSERLDAFLKTLHHSDLFSRV